MRTLIRYAALAWMLAPSSAKAQFETFQDSVVQLYGVVMTADSLRGLPGASIIVKGSGRGTVSNYQGVFSIVVLKGEEIEFTSVGFKPKLTRIPRELEGNAFSVIQLMVTDTVYLPASIIKPRPTREQFERDFVNTPVPDDLIEVARQNTDLAKRRILSQSMPRDGRESINYTLARNAARYYSNGQLPPMNLMNPFAWNEFIRAWKRGDFKKK
ncbi:MAG: carboxypeptidase-like regulatory domain-containing protein [Bacteroidetes bacterium]|nr:carboxypeptidase-like regulatory domain-containing protein [Bacteroidota bacterium]